MPTAPRRNLHKRLWDIYKELFEPAGMELGGMLPRASARYDRIRIEDDLRPNPALARRAATTPDGKPAAGTKSSPWCRKRIAREW